MWQTLSPQVLQILNNLDILQDVSAAPKIDFSGYPAAHMIPSDAPSDYETTTENERVYAFLVRAFAQTKSQSVEQAYLALLPVVDAIIDAFDQEQLKTTGQVIGVGLPDRYTYINVFATPSRFLDYTDAQMIFAEITVKIRISVDVSP
jgi:hypothetical protein